MKRNILLLVVVFLIAIQFVHFEKNQSTEILPTDITQVTTIPEDVLTILKTSCMIAIAIIRYILGMIKYSRLVFG